MARVKLRSRREVVQRVGELRSALEHGLDRLPFTPDDPAVVDVVWQAEGLGALLWALERVTMAPFDRGFDHEQLLGASVGEARLRDRAEVAHAREAARLWHWRARMAGLLVADAPDLPAGWQSFEQLIAVAALRGHERGQLPAPLRGDFPAFGTPYRALAPAQLDETTSIAYERHRALNWLCDSGADWASTPTET
jgi:hypothetical protein